MKEHRINKTYQNECFDDLMQRVTSEHALLVIDYKENIELNIGPDEVVVID